MTRLPGCVASGNILYFPSPACNLYALSASIRVPWPTPPTLSPRKTSRLLSIRNGWKIEHIIVSPGRPHPKDLDPAFSDHSVGHWEGDSLVVDSVGFNEKFWLTREGIPFTDKLHLIERFTRTDYNTLKYEATIDDPGAYTKTWTGGWLITCQSEEELYEYVCQDNNRDVRHMYGGNREGGDE